MDGFAADFSSTMPAAPFRAWHEARRAVDMTVKLKGRNGEDDDDDDSDDAEESDVEDETETVLQQQTIVTEQATANMDPMVTIVYTASLFMSGGLVRFALLQWTDQVLLLIVGTMELLAILVGMYQVVLRLGLPGGEDELAATEDARRRVYLSLGRWVSGILFLLNFAKTVLLLVIVALVAEQFGLLFAKSLPAFSAVLVLCAFLLVVLIVAFASHPSIGMLSRSNTFLTAKGPIGADD
jgi:hypothetical protein